MKFFYFSTVGNVLIGANLISFSEAFSAQDKRERSTCRRSFTTDSSSSSSSSLLASSSNTVLVEQLTDANFQAILSRSDATENRAVLLDVYAPWCGPCKLLEPILNKVVVADPQLSSRVSLVKFNTDGKNPQFKMHLVFQGVILRKLPTLILFLNGEAVALRSGLVTELELKEFLESQLKQETTKPRTTTKSKTIKSTTTKSTTTSRNAGFISFQHSATSDDYMLTMP